MTARRSSIGFVLYTSLAIGLGVAAGYILGSTRPEVEISHNELGDVESDEAKKSLEKRLQEALGENASLNDQMQKAEETHRKELCQEEEAATERLSKMKISYRKRIEQKIFDDLHIKLTSSMISGSLGDPTYLFTFSKILFKASKVSEKNKQESELYRLFDTVLEEYTDALKSRDFYRETTVDAQCKEFSYDIITEAVRLNTLIRVYEKIQESEEGPAHQLVRDMLEQELNKEYSITHDPPDKFSHSESFYKARELYGQLKREAEELLCEKPTVD